MTDLKLLREAACVMRQRAQAATSGPWETGGDGLVWPPRMGDPLSASTETEDAEHIASWHPAVAMAVADWIDAEADAREVLVSSVVRNSFADEVARAYLRGAS